MTTRRGNFSVWEKGQALLIVVLVMVVALTVGLSLASRSITNLRNTTDEANSQAAFSAAEAGVEQAVKLGSVTGPSVISGVSLNDKNNSQISNVSVAAINGDEFLLNNGNPIFQDDGTDIWLSPHSDIPSQLFQSPWNGTLNVYWGTHTDPCQEPAIELLIISGTKTSPTLSKYAYDSCSARRSGSNSFGAPPLSGSFTVNGVNGSQTFNYSTAPIVTNGQLARIIPLYTAGIIGIKGAGLPVQGKIITSTGTAGVSSSETVRKISFFQGYDALPSELFYSLFTPQ